MTAAKLFDAKIHKRANIGEFAGAVLASLPDLPLVVPRGVYSLDFYASFAKLHGKTHDYKLQFTDIAKVFLLPKPDGAHMAYLLQLATPLRTGSQLQHFLVLNLQLEREVRVKIKLSPEEMAARYGGGLLPEHEGKLYDVLSTLLQQLAGVKKIIVPGEFRNSRAAKSVNCSVRANEGLLFPLKSSLVFIHNPVLYVRHAELKHAEFSRTGAHAGAASRTFDLMLTRLKDEPPVTFLGIERSE